MTDANTNGPAHTEADTHTGTDAASTSAGTDGSGTTTSKASRTGLPLAAAVLTGTVALYMALVAFGNITDFGTNQQFVRHVLAMDTTFKDPDLMWRAITSHPLQDAAYVAIIVWETLAALVLIAATALWTVALRRGDDLARAQRTSTLGLLMILLLFGAGFMAVGGEWFAMWQSETWNGLEAAARNVTVAGIALVVVHLPVRSGSRGGGK
jgi:predicted small integral membrane protein